jgi:carbonic anhydrase
VNEPVAKLIGVKVAPSRYVQVLFIIKTQVEADALPKITQDYPCRNLIAGVTRVNVQFAEASQPVAISQLILAKGL